MKQKNNLKKIYRRKKINYIYTLIISISISTIISLNYIGNKIYPILIEYAKTETRKIVTIIINKAVSKQLSNDLNLDGLFTTSKTSSGSIVAVDYDPLIVNKILNITTNLIQLNLKSIEDGNIDILEISDLDSNIDKNNLEKGIIYEIPIGIISNNPILSNLGPKIPVKITLIGSVEGNLNTKITNYGINSALVEISVNITVSQKVILPFMSDEITIENQIPIAVKIMQGTVPNYYSNGIDSNSPLISIPIE